MNHRRWLYNLLAALALCIAAALPMAGSAYADVEYCGDEPPVLVRTPAGNPVLVNNYLTVAFANRGALRRATVTGSSEPAEERGHSRIKVTVHVPRHGKHVRDDDFEVAVKSVVQRYKVSKVKAGRSGQDITITLTVPLP